MMEDTNQVRGRARGRASPLVEQILRPGNVERSAGASASCVCPVNTHSLQSEIDPTTKAVPCLSLREQNREQVPVVPVEDTSRIYINMVANCLTGNAPILYEYRVDFEPDVDRSQVRKKILAQVYKHKLSRYMSDGLLLITSTPIPPGLLTMLSNFEGCSYKIMLHRVDTEQRDYHLSHLVHKCLKLLKLQIVGSQSSDNLAVRVNCSDPEFSVLKVHHLFNGLKWDSVINDGITHIGIWKLIYYMCKMTSIPNTVILESVLKNITVQIDYADLCVKLNPTELLKYVTRLHSVSDIFKQYDTAAIYRSLNEVRTDQKHNVPPFKISSNRSDAQVVINNMSVEEPGNILGTSPPSPANTPGNLDDIELNFIEEFIEKTASRNDRRRIFNAICKKLSPRQVLDTFHEVMQKRL